MDFGRYDAIFLPGGHGTMWDMPDSAPLAQGISQLLADGNLITGQNPQSAGKVARLLIDCLATSKR